MALHWDVVIFTVVFLEWKRKGRETKPPAWHVPKCLRNPRKEDDLIYLALHFLRWFDGCISKSLFCALGVQLIHMAIIGIYIHNQPNRLDKQDSNARMQWHSTANERNKKVDKSSLLSCHTPITGTNCPSLMECWIMKKGGSQVFFSDKNCCSQLYFSWHF